MSSRQKSSFLRLFRLWGWPGTQVGIQALPKRIPLATQPAVRPAPSWGTGTTPGARVEMKIKG